MRRTPLMGQAYAVRCLHLLANTCRQEDDESCQEEPETGTENQELSEHFTLLLKSLQVSVNNLAGR
jgi:hypothetical protein